MTDKPTPRAAILDRITEAEVVEWLTEQLREQERKLGFRLFSLTAHANQYTDGEIEVIFQLTDFHVTEVSDRLATIDAAGQQIKRAIESKSPVAEALRAEAAKLVAEADALEAEGTK